MFGLGIFRSGGPSSEAWNCESGFGCAIGGAIWFRLNFGALPFVAGIGFRSPPPPPPPALSFPEGNFVSYGEISSGVTIEVVGVAATFLATEYSKGENTSTVTPMCTASAIAWEGPKALSLDQISFTLTGLLVTCSGGSFGGEIRSRRFCNMIL